VEAIYCNRRALDGLLVAFFLGDVVNIWAETRCVWDGKVLVLDQITLKPAVNHLHINGWGLTHIEIDVCRVNRFEKRKWWVSRCESKASKDGVWTVLKGYQLVKNDVDFVINYRKGQS
jgi:hypothetical protein